MNPSIPRVPVSRRRSRGVAVIFVLLMLTLVSVVAISFFATSQSEYESSSLYEKGRKVDWLAQAAIDLAIAQLREGTTSKDSGEGNREGRIWASQPGAIRTFELDGSPGEVFKLYSDEDMMVAGASFDAAVDMQEAANWDNQSNLFADLNEEVNGSFPILDPASLPGNDDAVSGLSLTGEGEASFYDEEEESIAMPVKWLYVLQDGTMAAGAGNGSGSVTVPGASASNPIVGRIAFWTDDESSKVNVNTAGGDVWPEGEFASNDHAGTFHDTPRFSTQFEYGALDLGQPFRNEFQRYPGHPATTYLSAVFPGATGEQLGEILPRFQWGGTKGGTVRLSKSGMSALQVLETDRDRLYATVDELIFRPDRTEQRTINRERLESARFFLTANSRSPDQTPFGTPRVSAWPIHKETGSSHRTPFDDLIALCTEYQPEGGDVMPFHFTRSDPLEPLADFAGRNEELYEYLVEMVLSRIPGYDASFGDKFGDHDTLQILTSIYDYIRCTNLRDGSTGEVVPFSENGVVYPTVLDAGIYPTAGFGRFETVSEVGVQFIETTEDTGRSLTVSGADFGSVVPEPEKYERKWYRAVFLWEGNNLSQGFTGYIQNHLAEISGLSNIRVSIENAPAIGGQALPIYVNGRPNNEEPFSVEFPERASSTQTGSMGAGWHNRNWGGSMSPVSQFFYDRWQLKSIPSSGAGSTTGDDVYPFASRKFFVDWPLNISERAMRISMTGPARLELKGENGELALGTYDFELPSLGNPRGAKVPVPKLRGEGNARINGYRNFNTRIQDSHEGGRWHELIQIYDTVRTLHVERHAGDLRHHAVHSLVQSSANPGGEVFAPRSDYGSNYNSLHSFETSLNRYYPMQNLPAAFGGLADPAGRDMYYFAGKSEFSNRYRRDDRYFVHGNYAFEYWSYNKRPNFSDLYTWAETSEGVNGDWDNGTGHSKDGPFINKADDGMISGGGGDKHWGFYYGWSQDETSLPAVFSPNRIMPSAVMFGSLPTGVFSDRPWETLLFNPGPAAGDDHFSLRDEEAVPDHMLLEFFQMPVVEPYAISEPFSTAGRVNLNSQILPFDFVRRDTGLHAVLAGQRVTVVPAGNRYRNFNNYKRTAVASQPQFLRTNFRVPVDIELTVEGIRQRFDAGDLFRFPSEICEIFLVPQNQGFNDYDEDALREFWDDPEKTALSGDNVREKPYAMVYPRLTTRSNTYRVHVRAQLIQKARFGDPAIFDEESDAVAGEWRGSSLIERYMDPRNQYLVDYAKRNPSSAARDGVHLDDLHAIRTLRTKRFAP